MEGGKRNLRRRAGVTAGGTTAVDVYVASYNTRELTRRCIDSILAKTSLPFRLTVGDSASADGSLELLTEYERRGQLRLEVEHDQRDHAHWLDRWTTECDADYAVFVDSDVAIRRRGWLQPLVARAKHSGAAIVAAELCREGRNFVEPVGHKTVRLAERPAPWLMLVRPAPLAELRTSFVFRAVESADVHEGLIAYDVGAWLYTQAVAAGLVVEIMPRWYRLSYTHAHGGSWRR